MTLLYLISINIISYKCSLILVRFYVFFLKLMQEDMYICIYVILCIFLELQINMIILPRPPTKNFWLHIFHDLFLTIPKIVYFNLNVVRIRCFICFLYIYDSKNSLFKLNLNVRKRTWIPVSSVNKVFDNCIRNLKFNPLH